METTTRPGCQGCGTPLSPVEALRWQVCLDCTKARHRAATNRGRCSCGTKRRDRLVETRSRSWIACDRCLGVIAQVR